MDAVSAIGVLQTHLPWRVVMEEPLPLHIGSSVFASEKHKSLCLWWWTIPFPLGTQNHFVFTCGPSQRCIINAGKPLLSHTGYPTEGGCLLPTVHFPAPSSLSLEALQTKFTNEFYFCSNFEGIFALLWFPFLVAMRVTKVDNREKLLSSKPSC